MTLRQDMLCNLSCILQQLRMIEVELLHGHFGFRGYTLAHYEELGSCTICLEMSISHITLNIESHSLLYFLFSYYYQLCMYVAQCPNIYMCVSPLDWILVHLDWVGSWNLYCGFTEFFNVYYISFSIHIYTQFSLRNWKRNPWPLSCYHASTAIHAPPPYFSISTKGTSINLLLMPEIWMKS